MERVGIDRKLSGSNITIFLRFTERLIRPVAETRQSNSFSDKYEPLVTPAILFFISFKPFCLSGILLSTFTNLTP
jgi:hypothetical protein